MASIETRKSKDGKTTSYRVKWRTGGTGAQDGTTFDAHTDAKQFKALVEVYGHRWPVPCQTLHMTVSWHLEDRVRLLDGIR